jgi:BNR repeat-like domain
MGRSRRAVVGSVALGLVAGVLWLTVRPSEAPTRSSAAREEAARAPGEPGEPGAAGEPGEDETAEIAERLDALQNAETGRTLGRIEPIERDPAPGWAGARIVHPSHDDWEPAVAADPNEPWVYVAVTRYGAPLCADCPDATIMLERSQDGGKTWSKARPICRCRGTAWQADPILEVASDTGAVYAIWMNGWDVNFARSEDHGKTWSAPVSTKGKVPWNDKPAMTVSPDGQDVYVSWNGPSHGDAFVARSNDGGRTWRRRKVVDSDRYYFAYDGTVTPSGSIVFAESSIDYSGPDGAPVGAVKQHALISDDGGDTWRNVVVGTARVGVPCVSVACPSDYYIGHSSVASDADGNLVFVFDGAIRAGARQRTWVTTSSDGGDTWTTPVTVSTPHEESGFPMVDATGSGDMRMWYMETVGGSRNAWNVWYRASTDAGAVWSPPVRLSDVTSGWAYLSKRGFREPYGDYGEIAITSEGKTFAAWGEGKSYLGPGGVWFNRER